MAEILKMEIKHFKVETESTMESAYGDMCGGVVNEYLKTGYESYESGAEVKFEGIKYKVLKRDTVTAFYDADGNTLFDVENERLKQEYDAISKDVPAPNLEKVEPAKVESIKPAKERAKEKLEAELKSIKDKSFAEPIINYLLKRCDEDNGLAEDVLQKHKTWEKCFSFIYSKAREQSKGNCVAIRDDVVFEWSEDYYHKDDKAEEEKKAKEDAKKKKKVKDNKGKTTTLKNNKVRVDYDTSLKSGADNHKLSEQEIEKKKSKGEKEIPKAQHKKNTKDIEGQMDLFSMMGM